MTPIVIHLAFLSAKIALLGGLAWMQLYFLRRAPAASRSRICSLALIAIVLMGAAQLTLAPLWPVQSTVFKLTATAAHHALPPSARISASSWIEFLWMAGAGLMVIRAVGGRITLAMLLRRSTLAGQVSGLDVHIGEVETPLLTGLLRPAILLPASMHDWTDEQRRMVLTHEVTHFRQGDCWTNLLAQCVRAVFWFHPVVWLLVSRMSREQELSCDDAVVASGHSRHDYAAFLLDAVRNLHSGGIFVCSMAGSGVRSLKERFANLLNTSPRPALTRRLAVSVALCIAIATVLAVARPVWSQSEPEKQGEVYRAGGDVLPPTVLTLIQPQYTDEARMSKIVGPVYLSFVVTPEGNADDIEVTSGIDPGLDDNAIEAIARWKFQPGTRNGKAVAVSAHAQVNYRLQ